MKALAFTQAGDRRSLVVQDFPAPQAGPGQVLVHTHSCGVNFADVMLRRGDRPAVSPIAGVEAAGTVIGLGADVDDVHIGDRVVWPMVPSSYAGVVAVPVQMAAPVLDGVDFDAAVAITAHGLTAHYLTTDTFPLQRGHVALAHAAAGGVGRLLVQLARHRGARVLATTSSRKKFDSVRAAGADEVFTYEGFSERVLDLTNGRGVDVVYDSVGLSTFDESCKSLRRRGTLVLFGAASGPVPPLELTRLSQMGSLFVTVPTLLDHVVTRDELVGRTDQLFGLLQSGVIDAHIAGRFAFGEADAAFEQLESRSVVGKLVLVPPDTD